MWTHIGCERHVPLSRASTDREMCAGHSHGRLTGMLKADGTARRILRWIKLRVGRTRTVEPPPPVSTLMFKGPGLKLNLGSSDDVIPGFMNVDKFPGPGIEVADLAIPWPWPDNSVAHVRAWDIFEHLPDKIFTMNELWRVLVGGGTAEIALPTTEGPGAFQDPTHVSFWNRRSFLYYEDGTLHRKRFAASYGIRAKFCTVTEHIEHSHDGPRLTIILQAVKP